MNPTLAMMEEQTGETYARMVAHKGLREGEPSMLDRDILQWVPLQRGVCRCPFKGGDCKHPY